MFMHGAYLTQHLEKFLALNRLIWTKKIPSYYVPGLQGLVLLSPSVDKGLFKYILSVSVDYGYIWDAYTISFQYSISSRKSSSKNQMSTVYCVSWSLGGSGKSVFINAMKIRSELTLLDFQSWVFLKM